MIRWTLALLAGAVVAWFAYGRASTASRLYRNALAALRCLAVVLLAALLLGAPSAPARPASAMLALDASQSWLRSSGLPSEAQSAAFVRSFVDSLRGPTTDLILVGDSIRELDVDELLAFTPSDASSRVRPAVDRAAALGRPLLLITDGEIEDPEALADAPAGSSVHIPVHPELADIAIVELLLAANATGGDTLQATALVSAGGAGAAAGSVRLLLDGRPVANASVANLAPYASTRVSLPLIVPRGSRISIVTAVVSSSGDRQARNDTLTTVLEVGDRPPAVFVSTAPDLDVREALRLLRGALSLPTRAYLRLAPGTWREEGSLAPIAESEVRARAAAARLLILHGDTSFIARSRGARALWSPAAPTAVARAGETTRAPEWFVGGAPPSPVSASLAGLPWDTLPPVTLQGPARGEFTILNARLGRSGDAVAAIAGRSNQAGRTLVVSGSGYSGWALRGGRSAEAFTALWGSVFDWLAAARGDERAARPVPMAVRAGEPIRWRRGGPDTLVQALLTRRGSGGVDTLRLKFESDALETISSPLREGLYDIALPGGAAVLSVNSAREWIATAPTVVDGQLSPVTALVDASRLRESAWPFVLALLLLCGEWIGRRMAGLR